MTRRERALLAKLNDTRASLATMAATVRNLSAFEDARTSWTGSRKPWSGWRRRYGTPKPRCFAPSFAGRTVSTDNGQPMLMPSQVCPPQ